MTGFSASAAQLQATGAALSDLGAEVRGELAALRAEVDGLLSAGWRGQAAQGFAQGWREWENGAEAVLSALAMMAELLEHDGRTYGTAESASTTGVTRSGAGL